MRKALFIIVFLVVGIISIPTHASAAHYIGLDNVKSLDQDFVTTPGIDSQVWLVHSTGRSTTEGWSTVSTWFLLTSSPSESSDGKGNWFFTLSEGDGSTRGYGWDWSSGPQNTLREICTVGNSYGGDFPSSSIAAKCKSLTPSATPNPAQQQGSAANPAQQQGSAANPAQQQGSAANPAQQQGSAANAVPAVVIPVNPAQQQGSADNSAQQQGSAAAQGQFVVAPAADSSDVLSQVNPAVALVIVLIGLSGAGLALYLRRNQP